MHATNIKHTCMNIILYEQFMKPILTQLNKNAQNLYSGRFIDGVV